MTTKRSLHMILHHASARMMMTPLPRRMPRLLLLACLVCTCMAPVRAQNNDAEFLTVTHDYTLAPDGTITYRYEHELRLETSFAFTRQYGESFVVYDPAWQKLDITTSETRMANGRLIKAPFNAFNEVLPGFAHNAAPYSGMREMVVTHTGIERGAVIHFAYTLTTRPQFFPGLSARVMIGDRSPVKQMTVRVTVPKGRALRFAAAGITAEPVRSAAGGNDVYTWTFPSVAALPVETHQPPMDLVLPMLFLTTTDFDAIVRHVTGDALAHALDARAAAAADAAVKDAKTDVDKVRALQRLVANSTGAMTGEPMTTGFRAMPAQHTFDEAVGSSLDRAVLLTAMLQHAGVKARTVLHSPYVGTDAAAWTAAKGSAGAIPDDLACAHLFTSAGVEVSFGDSDPMLLDPTEPQSGRIAVRFARGAYLPLEKGVTKLLPVPGSLLVRSAECTSEWTLTTGLTLNGRSLVVVRGASAPSIDPDAAFARVRAALLPASAGIKVKKETAKLESDGAVSCEVSIDRAQPLAVNGGLLTMPIPAPAGAFSDLHLLLPHMERLTPVLVGRQEEVSRLTLHLPQGVRLAMIPQKAQLSNSTGSVSLRVEVSGRDVSIERRIRIGRSVVIRDAYDELRSLLEEWTSRVYSEITLRTDAK